VPEAADPHCESSAHPQTAAATTQIGLLPPHRVALVAEHSPHAPLLWHAGVAPPQSASEAQPTQMPAATLQAGVAPPHAAWLLAEHWPQVPSGRHAGVAPSQSASTRQPVTVTLATAWLPVPPLAEVTIPVVFTKTSWTVDLTFIEN
jgi:hypothetical protein